MAEIIPIVPPDIQASVKRPIENQRAVALGINETHMVDALMSGNYYSAQLDHATVLRQLYQRPFLPADELATLYVGSFGPCYPKENLTVYFSKLREYRDIDLDVPSLVTAEIKERRFIFSDGLTLQDATCITSKKLGLLFNRPRLDFFHPGLLRALAFQNGRRALMNDLYLPDGHRSETNFDLSYVKYMLGRSAEETLHVVYGS